MIPVAIAAARAGATVVREHRRLLPGQPVDLKGVGDYVTAIDRASEEAIKEVLTRQAPGIAILAEESGGAGSGTRWVVDPLDGTTNFVRGLPVVGVAVGLVEAGRPIVGVVIAPFLDLEFIGGSGSGVTLNGNPLSRFENLSAGSALVATGFPFRNKARMPTYQPLLLGALREFEDLRRAGAASLDLAWTASGSLGGFFELGLGPWDIVAGAALLIELGGKVTDWQGGDTWLESGDLLAGHPAVHEVLLELARDSKPGQADQAADLLPGKH
ncbi:MAG TPA: inositol monophosphatase family protein [Candidatus Dormibacteraeota bacterium]|nr:inositol monophosphatase family protein [Candidatus Dormibacteraeota bacterium]